MRNCPQSRPAPLHVLFVSTVFVYATACHCPPQQPSDLGLYQSIHPELLIDQIANQYPADFRSVHRAVIDLDGRNILATGFIAVQNSITIRMIAKNEFGGELFDAALRVGADSPIVKNVSPPLSAELVSKGPFEDVKTLFSIPPDAAASAFESKHGCRLLVLTSSLYRYEYLFSDETGNLTEIHRFRDDCLTQRIRLSNYKLWPAYSRAVPTQIDIERPAMHYRVRVQVIDFSPGRVSPRLLDESPDG